jgi:hypothetical protein
MSVTGRYKVVVVGNISSEPQMVTRADAIIATPDGTLWVTGDRQKRRFAPGLWKSITVENDGSAGKLEPKDAQGS